MSTRGCLLTAVVVFALVVPVAGLAEQGNLRYSIAVTKFDNEAGWRGQWDIGDAWDTVLTDMLNQSGKFIVLGETDMRSAAMDEQDFAQSGRTAGGNKAPVTGQMTPGQLLVKGSITHVQDDTKKGRGGIRVGGFTVGGKGGTSEINATVYVVDSTTGQVVSSTNVVGKSKKKGADFSYTESDFSTAFGGEKSDNVGLAVQDACARAVEFVISQLPDVSWTGSVVLVKGDQVYVNRGTREGVATGQRFQVGEVEILRDPDTGEVLDESMTQIATLACGQVKEKVSICSVETGNAADVTKGMTVHLP